MGRLFGMDGVRGMAVTELTAELAMQIGRAVAVVLRAHAGHRPTVIVGKDTRISSDILEAALCAGICAAGGDVRLIGALPVPAVAWFASLEDADGGVMISTAHNSVEYNGIKIFGGDGYRLHDDREAEIEALILDWPDRIRSVSGSELGTMRRLPDACERYLAHLEECISVRLDGLRLAIDCANGCAVHTAEKLFTRLGASVELLHANPDGFNINVDCGSMHIEHLMDYVVSHGCDAGLAFDGDADRCLMVDETGELVDGDKLIAICARSYQEQNKLRHSAVVVTVMSNLGFTYFAREHKIRRVTANVGDRYVLEKMLDGGFVLGGEQNGHIVFLDLATTGDGQLSGLKVLEALRRSGGTMSALACVMERFPQVMINVKIPEEQREYWKNDDVITGLIDAREEELGDNGRILVRESYTEPLIRVMIEGRDFNQINAIAMELSDKIRERVGG